MNPSNSHLSAEEENTTEQKLVFVSPLSKSQKRMLRREQERIRNSQKASQEIDEPIFQELESKSFKMMCGGFVMGLFLSCLAVFFYLHTTNVIETSQSITTSGYEEQQKYVVPFNELGEVNSEEEAALKIVSYSLKHLFDFFKQHFETHSIFEECFPEASIARNQASFNDHLRQFVAYYLRLCNKD